MLCFHSGSQSRLSLMSRCFWGKDLNSGGGQKPSDKNKKQKQQLLWKTIQSSRAVPEEDLECEIVQI